MKNHGVDWCEPCQVWHLANRRRRGGQPVRCSQCGGATKRMARSWWGLQIIERARRRETAIAAHSNESRFVRVPLHASSTNAEERP